jgi:hypothetical protein
VCAGPPPNGDDDDDSAGTGTSAIPGAGAGAGGAGAGAGDRRGSFHHVDPLAGAYSLSFSHPSDSHPSTGLSSFDDITAEAAGRSKPATPPHAESQTHAQAEQAETQAQRLRAEREKEKKKEQ